MSNDQYGGMHARQPTYLELIRRGARQHGARVAIVFGEQSLSFAEVDKLSSQLAHALYAQGLKQNDRIALLLNNSLLSVPLDFACVKAGLNRVPLNGRLSLPEHVKMLQETACTSLVFGQGMEQRAAELQAAMPALSLLGLGAAIPGALDGELDDAIREREQGVILAAADIFARVEFGAALANDDVAGENELTAVALDAKTLGL